MCAKLGVIYFKMAVSYGEPTEFDGVGCDGMYIESIEKTDDIAQLKAALTLIGDVAFDRDGYTGDADKLGKLIDEIYGYARNPQTAVDALKESE